MACLKTAFCDAQPTESSFFRHTLGIYFLIPYNDWNQFGQLHF